MNSSVSQSYKFEAFSLSASALRLETASGDEVRLEPQVLQLLILLVENHHRVVTKEEIHQEIWGGRIVTDASLASRLRALRSALGDNGTEQRLIRTIPNVGLRFVGEVQIVDLDRRSKLARLLDQLVARPIGVSLLVLGAFCLALAIWQFGFIQPRQALHAQFAKTPNAAIRYYNHWKIRDTTVENCMRACLEMTKFTCRSFDYYKRMNVCDLSAATAESVGGLKTNYELDPYDHYARKDFPPGPIELGRDDTLTPNASEKLNDAGVE